MLAAGSLDYKLNITGSYFSYFAAGALGKLLVYFAIGLVIFVIFNKSRKTGREIIVRSATNDTNDNLSN